MDEFLISNREPEQLCFALPDVTFLPDGIKIERELSGDEVHNLLSFVVHSHDAANWWAGDCVAYIFEARGEEAAREAARQFRDPIECWESMRVCQALNGQRIEKISFRHHRTALDECRGDAKAALRWILRAREENWKIPELRAKIRRASASVDSQQSRPGKICFTSEIRNFCEAIDDLLTQRPLDSWSYEECKAFLDDSRKIANTIAAVGAQAQTFCLI